jgi:hypothetical protein
LLRAGFLFQELVGEPASMSNSLAADGSLSLAAGSSSLLPGQEDPFPHLAGRVHPSLSTRGEIERLGLVLIARIAQAAPGEDDQEQR